MWCWGRWWVVVVSVRRFGDRLPELCGAGAEAYGLSAFLISP